MPTKPNFLILVTDEHSFRFLSARKSENGGEPCRTPTLDRLIEQGVHFDAAYCQNPVCVASRAALLSGLHSHQCPALFPETPTIASHLTDFGYSTAAVGKMHLVGSRQHAGFGARPYGDFSGPSPAHQKDPLGLPGKRDHIFMPSIIKDVGNSDIPESLLQESVVASEASAWLREHRHANPEKPWLMYASFAHPHFPLNAPARFFNRYFPNGATPPRILQTGDSMSHPMTRGALRADGAESQGFYAEDISAEETLKARAAYFACVDFVDEILGDFLTTLDRAGLLDNTIIIYTADHGELAGEHGLWWKRTWHEASVRVPLIVSLPEHRNRQFAAKEIKEPASLADLFPTICGLCKVPEPEGLAGVDLSPILLGNPCTAIQERPGVITEHLSNFSGPGTEYRMIRSARYKYVAFNQCADLAFDLLEDPDEQHNLVGNSEKNDVLEKLKTAVMDGFDFETSINSQHRMISNFRKRFPTRVRPTTANQIIRGDGVMVEADQTLEHPQVVSWNPQDDFDDAPE